MKRPTKAFVTYGPNEDHWTMRYPWSRKGTNIRKALEQFLEVMERTKGSEQGERRKAIAWLRSLLDAKPPDLFP